MEGYEEDNTSRRSFLQAGAMSILAAGAVTACGDRRTIEPTEAQRAFKRQGRSRVLIAGASSYESVGTVMAEAWKQLPLPLKNKSVFLKVNLVDYRQGRQW